MNRIFGSGNFPRGVFFGSRCARISVLVALAAVCLASPVWAQFYKEIKPRLTDRQAKSMQAAVGQAIRDQAGFGTNETTVTDYFSKYYFPKMTLTDSASLADLGDRREDLFRRFIRATPNAASQATLTNLSLKVATAISQGNYHPAVRYNGVLILGNLDRQIAGGRNNPTPPIPLPAATEVLLDLLEREDFKGVKVSPAVQLGALVGLGRHARFGVAPKYAERVTKTALDLIAQENPPEEVSKDIHHWMKCRAASVLANQHRQKPDATLQTALNALMLDEKLDLDNRCFVAGLMKPLDYAKADGLDSAATVAALGSLSQDVLKAEAKLASDYQQEFLGGGGGGGLGRRGLFGGGRGGGGNRRGDDGPKFERRQLLSRLRAIYDASGSLAVGVPDAAKAQLRSLLDAMKPARLDAADKNKIDLEIAKTVIQSAQDVNQVIRSWNQGAASTESAEDDFS